MLKTSSTDAAMQAAAQLTHALLHPAPAGPFATLGQQQLDALQQLASIFNKRTSDSIAKDTAPTTANSMLPTVPRVSTPNRITPSIPKEPQPVLEIAKPVPRVPTLVSLPMPIIMQHVTNATAEKPAENRPYLIPLDNNQPLTNELKPAEVPILLWQGTGPSRTPVAQTQPTLVPHDQPISNNARNQNSHRPSYQYANSVIDTATGKSCEYRHLSSGTVNGHSK